MGLQENLRDESVDKLEVRDPVNVTPTATLRETITLMRKHDLGCATVIDEGRKPLGMITESMLTEMLSHGPLPLDEPVKNHMSDRVPWVRRSDPIADVMEAMQLKNVRMLCVLDDKDRVVGLTGQRGLMEYVAEHFPGEVMVQRVGQTPYLADREGA
jgi:predicted transcriptional regulator